MGTNKGDRRLTVKELKRLYRDFDIPVSAFDCGEVCAGRRRRKIPYCCDHYEAVPVLYREEYAFLRARTSMWRPFRGRNPAERKMVRDLREDHIYTVCSGPKSCDRRYRGLVCRIFPVYPYLNASGEITGLYFNRTLRGKCILVDRPDFVQPAYIEQAISYWNAFLDLRPEEHEFYCRLTRSTENRVHGQGRRLIVIRPSDWLYADEMKNFL